MSRKLDALVAERVMGFTWWSACGKSHLIPPWVEGLYGFSDGRHYHFIAGKHYEATPIELSYSNYQNLATPPFSTDISVAWKVVEKMKNDNWRGSIEDFGNRYRINFSKGPLWQAFNSVEHIDVPLGICLAALRVIGVDEATIQEAMK